MDLPLPSTPLTEVQQPQPPSTTKANHSTTSQCLWFIHYLRPGDQSNAANAYRDGLIYDELLLAQTIAGLGDQLYIELKEEASNEAFQGITWKRWPENNNQKIALAIFGCRILLLPGLFPDDHDHDNQLDWVKAELSRLESLQRKVEEGRTLDQPEELFLQAFDSTAPGQPYNGWLMMLVLARNAVHAS